MRYLEPTPRTSNLVIRYNVCDVHDAKIARFDTIEEAQAFADFSKNQYISKVKVNK